MKLLIAAIAIVLASAQDARANFIYTYTSMPFEYGRGDYVGLDPVLGENNGADRIFGFIVLSESFSATESLAGPEIVTAGVLAYAFSDGHQVLTNLNSTATFFLNVGLDGRPYVWDGALTRANNPTSFGWIIDITSATGGVISSAAPFGRDMGEVASTDSANGGSTTIGDTGDRAVTTGPVTPWMWTATHIVPEPSTVALLALGVLATARRSRNGNRPS
ncbi:MAG TPA: PEP-CTERM sorting domain-containing protein [Vicinamibacterales bacterium]